MWFKAKYSTQDRGLIGGKLYYGNIVIVRGYLRIAVYDENEVWMTYNKEAFEPGMLR